MVSAIKVLFRVLDHDADGQAVLLRELEVALVMGRHGHDRAGPVFHEHEVADPDRHLFVVQGIDRIGAGEDAFLLLLLVGARGLVLAHHALARKRGPRRPAVCP